MISEVNISEPSAEESVATEPLQPKAPALRRLSLQVWSLSMFSRRPSAPPPKADEDETLNPYRTFHNSNFQSSALPQSAKNGGPSSIKKLFRSRSNLRNVSY